MENTGSKGDGKRTQEKQTLQKTPVLKDVMFEKPTKVSVKIFIDLKHMQCKKAYDQKLARNVICATVILNFSNCIVLDDSQRERHIEHPS